MPSIHRSNPIKLWSVNVMKYTGKKSNHVCGVGQALLMQHFIRSYQRIKIHMSS